MRDGRTNRIRTGCALGALALGAGVLGGCSSAARGPINAGSAVVFEHPQTVEWSQRGRMAPVHNRFEYARNDRARQIMEPSAMLATRQWPQAHPPRERRVRFRYWEQY